MGWTPNPKVPQDPRKRLRNQKDTLSLCEALDLPRMSASQKAGKGFRMAGVLPCSSVFMFGNRLELKAVKSLQVCKSTSSISIPSIDLGARPCSVGEATFAFLKSQFHV